MWLHTAETSTVPVTTTMTSNPLENPTEAQTPATDTGKENYWDLF